MRRSDRAEALRDSYGIEVTGAAAAADKAETLVITVKPQDMAGAAGRDRAAREGRPAGDLGRGRHHHQFIESQAGARTCAVVRVMSNTPVLVDEAMSVISAGPHAREQHLRRAEELLRPVGKVLRIPESQQDAATALSGSGPAYVYFLVEAMVDAGILLGMPRGTALEMVKQAVYGAATMLRESGEHPVILREAVTSPGGTTINAIRELETARRPGGVPGGDRGGQGPGPGARRRLGRSPRRCVAMRSAGRIAAGIGARVGTGRRAGNHARLRGCPFRSTNYAGDGRDWCAEYRLAQQSAGRGLSMAADATPLSAVRFLTVAEVATIMRVSKMTVYRLVHSGDLEAIRVGRSFRVPERAVNQYLRDAFVEAG